jgi:uncharacterized membrane protein
MLVLSYLGVLAVIPYAVEKNDPEVQWHAKHGLVLFVAELILSVVFWFLVHIPFLGCLAAVLIPVFWLIVFILHIFLIIKAINGERFLIPGISEYANRF